jgi:hypothetical protein
VPPDAKSDAPATLADVSDHQAQFARAAAGAHERQLQVVANPVDRLARAIEALLVVASQPLSVQELAQAAGD